MSSRMPGGRAPNPSERRLVIILGSLSAFGPLSIDMYLPALPGISRDLGVPAAQVQLTLSACLLGLALGQMIAGPLSDALGRRRPLLVGVAAYAVSSLLCVAAPSVGALVALRFVQGLAGSAGIVISRAVVRDLHEGVALARFFSLLMLVNGLAPILAPLVGGQLLRVTSWRGVFVVLALIGVVLLIGSAAGLQETLAPEHRHTGGIRATVATFRALLKNRYFMGYALSGGLGFAAMFAYIAGSPFVLQDIYGISPQLFSVIFGLNALGLVVASQVNGVLVGHVSPRRLLEVSLVATAVGSVALLAIVLAGHIGLPGVLPALFAVVATRGIAMPNSTTLALAGHPRTAGSASALLGMMQYATGAIAAPLVGVGGNTTAVPMAVVIAALGIGSYATFLVLTRDAQLSGAPVTGSGRAIR